MLQVKAPHDREQMFKELWYDCFCVRHIHVMICHENEEGESFNCMIDEQLSYMNSVSLHTIIFLSCVVVFGVTKCGTDMNARLQLGAIP